MKLVPIRRLLLALPLLLAAAAPLDADQLKLAIADGRVTLSADNVPVRRILEEWSRVGQTRIVNLEKLAGPPVTLRLEDVPEAQALAILLRSASGYLAAPRPASQPGVSRFDRVMILASSRPPVASPQPMRPAPAAVQPVQPADADPADMDPAFDEPEDYDVEPTDETGEEEETMTPDVPPTPDGTQVMPPMQIGPANRRPNVPRRPGMVPQPWAVPQDATPPPEMVPGAPDAEAESQPTGPTPVPTAPQTLPQPGILAPPSQPGRQVLPGVTPALPQPPDPNTPRRPPGER